MEKIRNVMELHSDKENRVETEMHGPDVKRNGKVLIRMAKEKHGGEKSCHET